jgi:hypothetical protein
MVGRFLEDGVTVERQNLMTGPTRERVPSLDAGDYDLVVDQLLLRFATEHRHWLLTRLLYVPEACEPVLERLFDQWGPYQMLGDGETRDPSDYFGVIKTSVPPASARPNSTPVFRVVEQSNGVWLAFGQLQEDPTAESGWMIRNLEEGNLETGPSTYFLCER